jgi:AcrR family transcriptional regulator
MPKVSKEHRQVQRARVLKAAHVCFSQNGFHRTSIDDILAEANMSAGALYLYFKGKDEIIEAIAASAVAHISEAINLDGHRLKNFHNFSAVLEEIFLAVDQLVKGGFGRITLVAWGEAQTDKNLKKIVSKQINLIRANMTELARLCKKEELIDSKKSPTEIGKVIFGLLPGYILQSLIMGDVSAKSYAATICDSF